jgi:Hint domain
MTTYTWTNQSSSNWGIGTNWNPSGPPPFGGDVALINGTLTAYTITYNAAEPQFAWLDNTSATATIDISANTMNVGTVTAAGIIDVDAGAHLAVSNVASVTGTGLVNVDGGAVTITGNLVLSTGALLEVSGNTGTLSVSTVETINSGATVEINSGAAMFASAEVVNGLLETTAGTGTFSFGNSNVSGSGTIEANGGTLDLTASLSGDNSVTLNIGASAASLLQLTGPLFNGNNLGVHFLGALGSFYYDDAGSDTNVHFNVTKLNVGVSKTNFIHLADTVSITNGGTGTGTTGVVVLSNHDTLTLSGITDGGVANSGTWFAKSVTDAGGGTDIFLSSVCYAAGTRILTPAGERAVEDLVEDDLVLTVAGEGLFARPIKWVGRRRIDLTSHPHPERVAPILIQRHAFAKDIPARDLCVSPDHGIFADGKLICARQLVNGATIRQVHGQRSVEYFHIELDTHAILLAEGLAAESYLDTGNRAFFANASGSIILHPDLTAQVDHPAREAGSCVPFVWEEEFVRPTWEKLAARAPQLGRPLPQLDTTADPDLAVMANGRKLRPIVVTDGCYQLIVPVGVNEVRLVSRASAPNEAKPWLEDRRQLGVYVERIVLRNQHEIEVIPLDHPALGQGWRSVEHAGQEMRRWTSGDAILRLPFEGPAVLEITATGSGLAYCLEAEVRREA